MTLLKCLIVDDDDQKIDGIRRAIELELGAHAIRIEHVGSAHAAVEALRAELYDLLVVDINLPLRTDEAPVPDGGVKLMRQVGRATSGIKRPLAMIGLTAYPELAADAAKEFHRQGWALLVFSPEQNEWEEAIVNKCAHLQNYLEEQQRQSTPRIDLGIVTALSDTELEAVLDLPIDWSTKTFSECTVRYEVGEIVKDAVRISIVACAAPEMGNPAAAMITAKLIEQFRPKVCIMAGICAGIGAEVGHIAVAEQSLHYESGKWTVDDGGEAAFEPAPRYLSGSNGLLEAIRRYKLNRPAEIAALPSGWRGPKCSNSPELQIGPFASGAAVIENREYVESLKFRDRKLIGIDMESYGFYISASKVTRDTEFAVIKGVCDKATPPKTDEFQKYAAYLSANLIYNFAMAEASVQDGLFRSEDA